MKNYKVREFKEGEWDVLYHGEDGYTYGSPDTFDSKKEAVAFAARLEKEMPNPAIYFLRDWLVIDQD